MHMPRQSLQLGLALFFIIGFTATFQLAAGGEDVRLLAALTAISIIGVVLLEPRSRDKVSSSRIQNMNKKRILSIRDVAFGVFVFLSWSAMFIALAYCGDKLITSIGALLHLQEQAINTIRKGWGFIMWFGFLLTYDQDIPSLVKAIRSRIICKP